MTTEQIRKKYLDFMQAKSHIVISSSSLVPENDPTTLFISSGMQPLLPYFLGQPHSMGNRITDSQKCFRSQDIEDVGDNRHTTFFEMLGNWSFGDYFKENQIKWMWEFLTVELGLPKERLYFTCFVGNEKLNISRDTESAELWQKLFKESGIDVEIGENPERDGIVGNQHIFYYNEKKNWWSRSGVPANMPEGEPGGPDTEMFFDFDPENIYKHHEHYEKVTSKRESCHVNCDCGRYIEIGNSVFMQYKKVAGGFEELAQKNVDFGGGLERITAAVENDSDIFMVDVFEDARIEIEKLSGKKYKGEDNENVTYAYRVILDHIRAATFLISDGVLPGNKDQMYFVRRLIRRAVRFARNLNINENFTAKIAKTFMDKYSHYKSLEKNKEIILSEMDKEESKFRITLERGIKEFEKVSSQNISGVEAFNLLQSFGFPIELTVELAKEKGLTVDIEEFEKEKLAHSDSSRTASAGKFKGGLGGDSDVEIRYHTATHLLHQALKMVLGDTVHQKGSNITVERLRFDFAYGEKMNEAQVREVEAIVNQKIKEALPVTRIELSLEEAKTLGATGLFADKYGDTVSVYMIGNGTNKEDGIFSMELCGGPHVNNTSELGTFKIAKEEAVSAGVRRIKAVLS